jgi:hypothetical protein
VDTLIETNHPSSDAEIRLPDWQSLEQMKQHIDLDSASSIEFQPERAGQRRLLFVIRDDAIAYKPQSHHERKMDSQGGPIQYKPEHRQKQQPPKPVVVAAPVSAPILPTVVESTERQRIGRLKKDTFSNLPDTYRLESMHGDDLGLAAIRSLEISKQLREKCKTSDSVLVDILWFEPFQKYEVKKVHTS